MWENGISIDQVLYTILMGTVNKKEKDERSKENSLNTLFLKKTLLLSSKTVNQALSLPQIGGD